MNRVSDERIEWLAKQVVDIAFHIRKALGPGILEKVYETCFPHELAPLCLSGQKN